MTPKNRQLLHRQLLDRKFIHKCKIYLTTLLSIHFIFKFIHYKVHSLGDTYTSTYLHKICFSSHLILVCQGMALEITIHPKFSCFIFYSTWWVVIWLFMGHVWWPTMKDKEIEGPSKLVEKFEHAKLGVKLWPCSYTHSIMLLTLYTTCHMHHSSNGYILKSN